MSVVYRAEDTKLRRPVALKFLPPALTADDGAKRRFVLEAQADRDRRDPDVDSPDGQRLIVSSDRAGNPDLWTLPADGGAMESVATDPTPEWRADFSPDGARIGFYAYRSGRREVWLMPVAGGAARQLTDAGVETTFSGWSPDRRHVLAVSTRDGSQQIWVVPIDGGPPRRLTDMEGLPNHPSWSPDGRRIVFPVTASGSTALWKVPAAGGQPERLTRDFAWLPRWAPDGGAVYFNTTPLRPGGGNIFAVSPDGGVEPAHRLSGPSGAAADHGPGH